MGSGEDATFCMKTKSLDPVHFKLRRTGGRTEICCCGNVDLKVRHLRKLAVPREGFKICFTMCDPSSFEDEFEMHETSEILSLKFSEPPPTEAIAFRRFLETVEFTTDFRDLILTLVEEKKSPKKNKNSAQSKSSKENEDGYFDIFAQTHRFESVSDSAQD